MSLLVKKYPNQEVVQDPEKNTVDQMLQSGLSGYVNGLWDEAKRAKNQITERLLKCERQRRGEYDPEKEAEIAKIGGSDIFMMITDVKCRAAESWIKDVMINQQERIFELDVSEYPEVPPEMKISIIDLVKQEAMQYVQEGGQIHPDAFRSRMEEVHNEVRSRIRMMTEQAARNMEDLIEDQLHAGKFELALRNHITDFVTFPTAIIKGPVVKKRKKLKWGKNFEPIIVDDYVREVERVSPYDIFPAPSSIGVNDGYLFHRQRFTRAGLLEFSGVPGTDEAALATILDRFGRHGYATYMMGDSERRTLEGKPYHMPINSGMIETLEFWGSVRGAWLKEWGMSGVDKNKEYEVNLWSCGGEVFRCILNPDPIGNRPYNISSWEDVPDSFWGKALPEVMADSQTMANAAARSLANNMGISSGPQVEVTLDRLADGEKVTDMYPWKIWQVTSDRTGGGQPAIRFFQPDMNAAEMLQVYNNFVKQADEITGIPNYISGNSTVGGAGRTASGLSMLMDNASKGIKQGVANIDKIVTGIVQRLYLHNMMYNPDPYIKGDFNVVSKGAIGLIQKEALQMRRNEFLQTTGNEIDMSIVGKEGRGYILREVARGLQMDTEKIVPSEDSLQKAEIQEKAQAMAQQMVQQLAQQAQAQQQQAPQGSAPEPQAAPASAPQPTQPAGELPGGEAAGGASANVVSPRKMADGGAVEPADHIAQLEQQLASIGEALIKYV